MITDLNGSDLKSIGNISTTWTVSLQFGSNDSSLVPSNGIPYKGSIIIKMEDGTTGENMNSDETVDEAVDLDVGAIIGIVFGVIIFIAIMVAPVFCLFKMLTSRVANQSNDNPYGPYGPIKISNDQSGPTDGPQGPNQQSNSTKLQANQVLPRALPRAIEIRKTTPSNQETLIRLPISQSINF